MKQLTTQEMESVQGGFLCFNVLKGALTAGSDNPGFDVGEDAGKKVTEFFNNLNNASFKVAQTGVALVKGFFSGLFGA